MCSRAGFSCQPTVLANQNRLLRKQSAFASISTHADQDAFTFPSRLPHQQDIFILLLAPYATTPNQIDPTHPVHPAARSLLKMPFRRSESLHIGIHFPPQDGLTERCRGWFRRKIVILSKASNETGQHSSREAEGGKSQDCRRPAKPQNAPATAPHATPRTHQTPEAAPPVSPRTQHGNSWRNSQENEPPVVIDRRPTSQQDALFQAWTTRSHANLRTQQAPDATGPCDYVVRSPSLYNHNNVQDIDTSEISANPHTHQTQEAEAEVFSDEDTLPLLDQDGWQKFDISSLDTPGSTAPSNDTRHYEDRNNWSCANNHAAGTSPWNVPRWSQDVRLGPGMGPVGNDRIGSTDQNERRGSNQSRGEAVNFKGDTSTTRSDGGFHRHHGIRSRRENVIPGNKETRGEPSNTGGKPSYIRAGASKTREQVSSTTDEPSSTRVETSNARDEPANTRVEPTDNRSRPTNTIRWPSKSWEQNSSNIGGPSNPRRHAPKPYVQPHVDDPSVDTWDGKH